MDREILFRGKREDNGEWVEGFYVNIGKTCPSIATGKLAIERNKLAPEMHKVIPETVGQYIGLTDKNGRKIFEGDIVKYVDKYGQEVLSYIVEWSKDSCMFFLKCIGFDDRFDSDFDVFYGEPEPFEIVGNIHDNPELVRKDD